MESLAKAFNEFAGLRWNDAIENDPTVGERESEANVLCILVSSAMNMYNLDNISWEGES